MFAFNKNQPLMPVGATASGGEISRLMLSIKSIVAEKMNLPSIIFDEVDTGVSGDIANRMAQMMSDIAKRIQVITITHLPQVAARGNAHFKVYKEDDEHATTTRIRRLSEDERIAELSLMLSGATDNQTALAAARDLLANS
jgi:DNA repair protein RecN (Recombination protein N)